MKFYYRQVNKIYLLFIKDWKNFREVVILVVYLNKEHDLNKKYEECDALLTPLMVFLNNVLDYKGKQEL